MKKWWAMVGIVAVAVVILAVCLYGLPFDLPAVNPSSTGNAQLGTAGTTLPPETTKETFPVFTGKPFSFETTERLSDEEITIYTRYVPETVDNPENLPVLKWVCLASTAMEGFRSLSEDVVHEINQMLEERDMPFKIQFILLTWEQITQDPDWFTRPAVQEVLKSADLIYATATPEETAAYFAPITEYVTDEAQPTLKNAVPHALMWHASTVDGEIYGIPTYTPYAFSQGWFVKADVFQDCGLTAEDFYREFWEMDEIFAKIYENNGNQPFLGMDDAYFGSQACSGSVPLVLPGSLAWTDLSTFEYIGAVFAIDNSAGKPTVINYLETERICNMQKAILRYKTAGYITNFYSDRQIEYSYTNGNTSDDRMESVSGSQWISVPVTPSVYRPEYFKNSKCGIGAYSKNKEDAILLLNLIAEDEEFRDLLLFGKEGRDYMVDNNMYSKILKEDGTSYNMEILSPYNALSEALGSRGHGFPTYDGMNRLESFQERMDNVSRLEHPMEFDYSGFGAELEQIAAVITKYFPYFTTINEEAQKPFITEEIYEQMLQEFKDAGSEKIIAELQRQLDTWLTENPDWETRYGSE